MNEKTSVDETNKTAVGRKLALITGGTSGIGLGIACELAADCDLVLAYASNHEKAERAKKLLLDINPDAQIYTVSGILEDETTCLKLTSEIASLTQRGVDILVNSAGRLKDGLYMQSPLEDHLQMIKEHLTVPMILSHQLMKHMYKNKFGRIIHLSSISARRFKVGQVNYTTVKAGVEGFTKALARETAHRGITVNALAPGLIDTPMTEHITGPLVENKRELKKKIPAGRLGVPSDVAKTVRFLVSQEASYITGQVIDVCGGRSLVGD